MGNLSLTTMATNSTDKEVKSNDADAEVESALTDLEAILVDNTNARTLTTTEWTRNMHFALRDGSPVPTAAVALTVPATLRGIFVVRNELAFAVTVAISGQPIAGPILEPGALATLTSDGVNVLTTNQSVSVLALPITTLREIVTNDIDVDANHGGILTSNSTPALARVNGATDKALRVNWVATNVDEVQFEPVLMPPDLDHSRDLTIHLLARMSGATDAPTIDVQVFDAIGDTEMGSATAALSATLAELTVTIVAANISGHPLGFLNVALLPGAHGTDALELFGAWIEYPRKAV